MNINSVILGGNLTANPETKQLGNDNSVTEFTVATNERWKSTSGDKMEKAHFFRCFCYGKQGEVIAKWFTKGARIIVEGSLAQDQWEDKETGKKQSKTRVKVTGFHFVDAAKKEGNESQREPREVAKPPRDPDLDGESDDVPF